MDCVIIGCKREGIGGVISEVGKVDEDADCSVAVWVEAEASYGGEASLAGALVLER